MDRNNVPDRFGYGPRLFTLASTSKPRYACFPEFLKVATEPPDLLFANSLTSFVFIVFIVFIVNSRSAGQ